MKTITATIIFICITTYSYCQTSIPEGGFENWVQESSYEEPAGNWWTSLNSLNSLGGPVTVTKVTDFYSGSYAAKLETKMWGTFILPGLLVSGTFITSPPFVIQGQPFTDKPIRFKGYYKYISVNNDSAAIFAMLTKHNSITGKRDTLAIAKQAVLATTLTYTPFNLEFIYSSSETPDSIDVVFSSSANGANFSGQIGSTLVVDEIVLEYGTGVFELLTPEVEVSLFPNPAAESISVTIDNVKEFLLDYTIYSFDGKIVQQGTIKSTETNISITGIEAGKYLFNVYSGKKLLGSKKIIVI